MEQQKSTIILVHAAWLGAWQWDSVVPLLRGQGHKVLTPDLPGHGGKNMSQPAISMEDYVDSLTDLIDMEARPVVLLGHSFNGITVSRVAELRPDKVKCLIYLTAFLLPGGASFFNAVQMVKGSKAVDNFYLSEDKAYGLVKEDEVQHAFAQDIPKEAFEQAKPFMVPEPAAPLMYELEISDKHFGRIPKYYIECTQDNAIPIEVQRAMYKGQVKEVFSMNSSHTPNFSQPARLVTIIDQIASK